LPETNKKAVNGIENKETLRKLKMAAQQCNLKNDQNKT